MLPNYYHPLQKQKNPNNAAIQYNSLQCPRPANAEQGYG